MNIFLATETLRLHRYFHSTLRIVSMYYFSVLFLNILTQVVGNCVIKGRC